MTMNTTFSENNVNYTTPIIPSHKVKKLAARNIPRLGRILSITGKRFTSKRFGVTTSREAVVVKGFYGTARFFGVCWSYPGSGPHALRDILMLCGLTSDLAERIAFRCPRNDCDGVDWQYNLLPGTLDENWRQTTRRQQSYPPNYVSPQRIAV